MKNLVIPTLLTFTLAIALQSPSHAFFGKMNKLKDKMIGKVINPTRTISQICENSMGQMGLGIMNKTSNIASSVPVMGSMFKKVKNGMSGKMMKLVLSDREQTLNALTCAKNNEEMVRLMLDTMTAKPSLLYRMGDTMAKDKEIAKSMIELATQNNKVGRFFLEHTDRTLFEQISRTMLTNKEFAYDLINLLSVHKKEFLQSKSSVVIAMKDWGTIEDDSDAAEMAFERLLYSTFKDIDTAGLFFKTLISMDQSIQNELLDLIFLGKIKDSDIDFEKGTLIDSHYKNQAFYNIYATIYGLVENLFEKGQKIEEMSIMDLPRKKMVFMAKVFRLMNNQETGEMTDWGKSFMGTMMTGAHVHSDPIMASFAQFIINSMKLTMEPGSPMPNIELDEIAPGPRDFY